MRARVLAAATVAVLLSTGTVVPADAAPPTALAPGVTAPCPKLPTPAVTRPPRPTPPEPVPAQRAVGGEALATPGLVVPPGTPAPPPVTATSWLVADLDSGEVLGGCGPHEYATPASVQKLLLAATMLPKLDPKQVATVTREDLDIEPGSSAVGLLVGGRYPVETVWLGLLLQSGNEAANLLARLGAGSAEAGVREMNAEARRLGALQTHAVTPSGLDGPGQFTSAYDLALIARVCFANPTFRRYALTERAQIPAQPALRKRGFQIQNENPLIYDYPGALGGKTGFTDLARHTYVGAAERNGRRLVVTLLNAERRPVRAWEQGARLLDWGFSLPPDSSVGRLVQPGEVTGDGAGPNPAAAPDAGAAVAAGRSSGGAPEWLGGAVVGGSAGLVGLLAALLAVGRRRRRPRRRAVQWD
ncbi:D-alanyl-D-alanine carboxypeptidase (penicillin-binding protein 5/6) [Micromonospora purpureochromogenes]|uniref:D-alanyl-D-alanine carboxypeptidase (Penicillin-binding protein 5/6) n=1 Tax=Micromonospora purpureochromogenes TaxID=47872 RepID=A0A1C4YAI8_9ACTN|nr:serine hydrolase [Micromonospora purpureochromogenes]SCF17656.1 D-alanyl-D-alanine carboxypeptidase (penicillin-binding protein 5/6) [Micromonospora purpureochromogenes]